MIASALEKRFQQGWIQEKETDIETVIRKIKEYKKSKRTVSIGWLVGSLQEMS